MPREHFVRDACDGLSLDGIELCNEMVHKQGDILTPLLEIRQAEMLSVLEADHHEKDSDTTLSSGVLAENPSGSPYPVGYAKLDGDKVQEVKLGAGDCPSAR